MLGTGVICYARDVVCCYPRDGVCCYARDGPELFC